VVVGAVRAAANFAGELADACDTFLIVHAF
jgi:hypothetical protein